MDELGLEGGGGRPPRLGPPPSGFLGLGDGDVGKIG